MNLQFSNVGPVISLALAPVFFLAGVSIWLIVLTNRLGRTIDRIRTLEDRRDGAPGDELLPELLSLHFRCRLINIAITAGAVCGLLICFVVAMLFLGDTTALPLDHYIAVCFIGAMGGLIASMVYFMREIFLCYAFTRGQQIRVLAANEAELT